MIFHRLTRAPFTRLDGEGARLFGGRWNSAGRPAIYIAASPSLALLDILVHLDLPAGFNRRKGFDEAHDGGPPDWSYGPATT